MRIANNVIALNVNNYMNKADRRIGLSMGRLSSGVKLNRSKDDSAGYAIATRLDMQVQGYNRGSENALDAVSLLQTAEGSLTSIQEMLQRGRELAVQAANGTNTEDDRIIMQDELEQYLDEIDQVVEKASFNGIQFLNGRAQRMSIDSDSDNTSLSYVSSGLPAGDFSYDITTVGQPATYTSGYDGTQTISQDGSLTINGSTIDFKAGESAATIYEKVLKACDSNNLSFDATTGEFSTLDAGSKYSISISGDASVLADLGMTPTAVPSTNVGTDAEITITSYTSSADGNPVPFNPTIVADGNKITLSGLNNQSIEIKIEDDAVTGSYTSEITNGGQLNIQLGGNSNSVLGIYIPKVNTETLGIDNCNISTQEGATMALDSLDKALEKVSTVRATIGAYENRLDYSSESLLTASNATTVSLSRIRDTDMAAEMANYTKDNVIFQAGTSILAQANQRPQLILQLIG